jgi:hypothetical protein
VTQLAHDELVPMALGYVHAWLTEDYWTIGRIRAELAGADAERVAETFSVIAASLLTEACGGDSAKAAVLARRQYSQRVGREARYSSISASSLSADQSG